MNEKLYIILCSICYSRYSYCNITVAKRLLLYSINSKFYCLYCLLKFFFSVWRVSWIYECVCSKTINYLQITLNAYKLIIWIVHTLHNIMPIDGELFNYPICKVRFRQVYFTHHEKQITKRKLKTIQPF